MGRKNSIHGKRAEEGETLRITRFYCFIRKERIVKIASKINKTMAETEAVFALHKRSDTGVQLYLTDRAFFEPRDWREGPCICLAARE